MKTNKSIIRILSAAIIICLIFNSSVFAAGKVYKDETIYVNLDNQGKDEEKYASVRLHSNSSLNRVEDKSILKEVENIKGNEKPEIENGKLIWESDKKDIYYQGEPGKSLPVETKIKYYLDGNQVQAEEIAGESGELEINIEIENKDKQAVKLENGEYKTVYVPYIIATSVILPMNKFENIEINTGNILSDGSNQILNFVSLPGLEESLDLGEDILDIPNSLEIKADVEEFEMLPIVFAVTSEVPELEDVDAANDFEELLDGIDSIVEASEELNKATGELYNGQEELYTGVGDLLEGINAINKGTRPLSQGALELKDGIDTAYKGSLDLSSGTSQLSKSAGQIGDGIIALGDGTMEYGNKALEFSQGANELAKGVSIIPESTEALAKGMEELLEGTGELEKGQEALAGGLNKNLEALASIKAGKEKEDQAIGMLLEELENIGGLIESLESIPGAQEQVAPIIEGLEKQKAVLEEIKNSSSELLAGLSQLEEGVGQAELASKELWEGSKGIKQGQKKVKGGLDELNEGAKELQSASGKLDEASQGLEKGAKDLKENAGKAKQGVDQFTQGGDELAEGSHNLSQGLKDLSTGSNQLNEGVSELSNGGQELLQGGQDISKGSKGLLDGSKELDKGMEEFHRDGIKEMDSQVDNSYVDVNRVLEMKDELVKLSKDNNSFSGISEGMEGSLKFIMKTEGVNWEVEEDEIDVEVAEEESSKGFIEWLKSLFG